ncbi:response regulator transcription factor [Anaerocolumna sp. AGMB13025]|jgi:two-component system, OmpR family, lantibiotic biosynthesis response regulator NisR/SpaR|uniref:response regulator transcription factor n=1 Tax=Anaerocolumna sp. AGMB13025 TaxID=3039116 RepID=UPI00241BE690|nr:response regulator transcription factor [Anaerocolumna sp. AGMB13025]WFR56126.1 response regulator transcription factor [Anaerocolumna sp. AGMB13025]
MSVILSVDDDIEIQKLIKKALESQQHTVITYFNSKDLDIKSFSRFDLIILDVMMPNIDGFTLCSMIREVTDCPILFLTARNNEADLITGLSLGADDYICKPFGIGELRARVEAHLRREYREKSNSFQISGLRFAINSKEVYWNNILLPFTKSEYGISEFLALHRGQVFSREQIYQAVFGFDKDSFDNVIVEHIKNIRNKLNVYGISVIDTVWGIGYRWKEQKR